MNKAMVGGVLIGVALATSGAVVAGFASRDSRYAEVLDVQPVTQEVRLPRQVCGDELVEQRRPVQDEHRVAGTAIGAVLGGVLGHQVGNGNGRTLATAAGAAAGTEATTAAGAATGAEATAEVTTGAVSGASFEGVEPSA